MAEQTGSSRLMPTFPPSLFCAVGRPARPSTQLRWVAPLGGLLSLFGFVARRPARAMGPKLLARASKPPGLAVAERSHRLPSLLRALVVNGMAWDGLAAALLGFRPDLGRACASTCLFQPAKVFAWRHSWHSGGQVPTGLP